MPPPGAVLLVDDHPDIREAVRTFLAGEGILTVTVANGRDALDLLRTGFRPSVILLDWAMPEVDGFAFRRAQLADADLARIPVIVLSAGGSSAQAEAAKLGIHTFLGKPVVLDELVENVRKLLGDSDMPPREEPEAFGRGSSRHAGPGRRPRRAREGEDPR